jgi:hypothetical protein
MSSTNILIALFIIAASLTGVYSLSNKSFEGFLGNLPSMIIKNTREYACSPQQAAKGRFFSVPDDFQVPSNFQAELQPRFSNTTYGPNIRYKQPDIKNTAVPVDPLNPGGTKKSIEPYISAYNNPDDMNRGKMNSNYGGYESNNCRGTPFPPNYSDGNYANSLKNVRESVAKPNNSHGTGSTGSKWYEGIQQPLRPNYSDGNYENSLKDARTPFAKTTSIPQVVDSERYGGRQPLRPNYSDGNYDKSVMDINRGTTGPQKIEHYTNCPNSSNGSVWYNGIPSLRPDYTDGNYDIKRTSILNGSTGPIENFKNTLNPSDGCGKTEPSQFYGAPLDTPDYASGNYQDIRNKIYGSDTTQSPSSSILPIADTSAAGLDPSQQPIIYDRYIVANRTSRLRAQADKIRGDIPITPNQTAWFQVSVKPNIDLEAGAMNIMGGVNNETANKLAELIYTSSGNTTTAIGGVNMSTQLSSRLGAGGSDLSVSAM